MSHHAKTLVERIILNINGLSVHNAMNPTDQNVRPSRGSWSGAERTAGFLVQMAKASSAMSRICAESTKILQIVSACRRRASLLKFVW